MGVRVLMTTALSVPSTGTAAAVAAIVVAVVVVVVVVVVVGRFAVLFLSLIHI